MNATWIQRFRALHGNAKSRPSRQAMRAGYSFMAWIRKPKLDKATRKALRKKHIQQKKFQRKQARDYRRQITLEVQTRLSCQIFPLYCYQPMYRWNLDVPRATDGWWIPINATNPERHELVRKGYWRESLGTFRPSEFSHPTYHPAR